MCTTCMQAPMEATRTPEPLKLELQTLWAIIRVLGMESDPQHEQPGSLVAKASLLWRLFYSFFL